MWCTTTDKGKFLYRESYTDPYTGKRKTVSVTMDKDSNHAVKQATKILQKKIDDVLSDHGVKSVRFGKLFEEWWEFYKNEIKHSSLNSLQVSIDYINKTINSETIVNKIDVKYIQKYLNKLDVPRSKLERIKSLLNLFFDYALNLEYINDNPARKAKIPKKILTIEDFEKVQNKFLEVNELQVLLKELYRRPNTYRLGLISEFMSLNGCRVGEAISLTPKDFNRKAKTINIHGTFDHTDGGYSNGIKTTPKTNASWRTVALSDREIEILDEYIEINQRSKEDNPNYKDMGYIFVTKRGIPIQNNSFNLAIQRANLRLEKPLTKNLTTHIFRHSLISLLAERMVPLNAIMERVGHKDSKTTQQIYMHVTEHMKSNIVDILNSL